VLLRDRIANSVVFLQNVCLYKPSFAYVVIFFYKLFLTKKNHLLLLKLSHLDLQPTHKLSRLSTVASQTQLSFAAIILRPEFFCSQVLTPTINNKRVIIGKQQMNMILSADISTFLRQEFTSLADKIRRMLATIQFRKDFCIN
jgi:hypothetical protein